MCVCVCVCVCFKLIPNGLANKCHSYWTFKQHPMEPLKWFCDCLLFLNLQEMHNAAIWDINICDAWAARNILQSFSFCWNGGIKISKTAVMKEILNKIPFQLHLFRRWCCVLWIKRNIILQTSPVCLESCNQKALISPLG